MRPSPQIINYAGLGLLPDCFVFHMGTGRTRLTLRGVNKDQNPTLTKKLLYAGTCQEPHPPASCLGGDLTHIRLFDQPTKPRPKWYSFSFINFKIPGLGEKKLDIVSQIMFFSFIFFLKEILCTTPVGQFDVFTFQ